MATKSLKASKSKINKHRVGSYKNKGFEKLGDLKRTPSFPPIFFLILVLLAIFAYFKYQGVKKSNDLSSDTDNAGQVEATLESRLKDIYEERAGTDLGDDFSPRFSVFEDYQLGFRVAYPVGFKATSQVNGVKISSESDGGSVAVMVGNGTFDVKTNKDGLSEKQAEIIESSSVFIRDSFQFIDPEEIQDLRERFSGGPGKDRY